MMKKIYTLLSFFALLVVSTANAQSLYSNISEFSRFNPGLGVNGTPIIIFDDINIPNEVIGDADSIGITKIKVGIRQIASAPAVTVKVYMTKVDTAALSAGFDSLLVSVPPVLIGTFNLTANPSTTTGRTQILSIGDSVNLYKVLASDPSNLLDGFQTFFLGVSFSDANTGNGWRTTSGPDANIDAGWSYDVDDPAPSQIFGLTNGSATFYAEVFGRQIYRPVPFDAKVADVTTPDNITCFSDLQTVTVKVQNIGTSTIAIGVASVKLKVGGANTYTRTITNPAPIPSNGTQVISFTDVPLSGPGFSIDTAIVTIPSDARHSNDTFITASLTAETVTAFPAAEDAEGAFPVVAYLAPVAGTRQLWDVLDSGYINTDMFNAGIDSLHAHSGTGFFIFDSYSGASSDGFISRLFTNCITLTRSIDESSNYMTFWMSHDTLFTGADDSLYVSVSVDKGVTWTRLPGAGFARLDPAFTTPGWRMENVDLSAYGCKTIQIGFEGVSHYGNAFGLDDVTVNSTGDLNCVVNTTFNWTGNISTAWENAGNWATNAVPTATSNVIIPAARPRYPIVSVTTTVKSVTCAPGTSVNVAPGVVLNILK